jgi:hypothetical protein
MHINLTSTDYKSFMATDVFQAEAMAIEEIKYV